MCSFQSLYAWIWKDRKNGGGLYRLLRRRGKRYRPRGPAGNSRRLIPDAVDISERPSVVDERSRFGDFEIDTIVGCRPSQHILTVVERKSRLLLMRRLPLPTAAMTKAMLVDLLRPLCERRCVRTITADNGLQFAMHKAISAATGAQVYFAKPYHAWERGTNENTNGLIREFIPKGTDFDRLSDRDIFEIQMGLNARPRKVLGYSTPIEQLYLLTGIDARVAFQP
jgi:IS30 family transposase